MNRMTLRNIARIGLLLSLALLVLAFAADQRGVHPAPVAYAQARSPDSHCQPVGGTAMTNFGAIDQNTTMGTATGDLRGTASGTILGAPQPRAPHPLLSQIH